MGRRLRGAALRAVKRSKVVGEELIESKAKDTETQQVSSKADEDLFVLDTTAVMPSKKQLAKKEINRKKQNLEPSAKEQAQIQKLIDTHSADKLQELSKVKRAKRANIVNNNGFQPAFDLWGEKHEDSQAVKEKKKKAVVDPVIGSTLAGIKPSEHVAIATRRALLPPSKGDVITIEVAKAGQSYNPDRVLHNKVLIDAIQVEKKREKAEKESKAPISTGMSEETRALILGDSDTEDDDESEQEEDAAETTDRPVERVMRKLTRAERNKKKRVRAEQKEIESRKRQKKLQNSVAEAKAIVKELKRKELTKKKEKEKLEQLKQQSQRPKGKNLYENLAEQNPINAPIYPVALSIELKKPGGSSLRSIKPKGSLITDRMLSLTDRDMAPKKQLKQRRRVQGKRRKAKLRVRGKGYAESKESEILG